jgi:PEP-CTERM motif
MKILIPALAAAFLGMAGASSGAQAAIIDFSAVAQCPSTCTGITYSGSTLQASTGLDLDGSVWTVVSTAAGDKSGLAFGDTLSVMPVSFIYGSGSGPITLTTPIVKTWTGTAGSFTEKLTTLDVITRGVNTIALNFSGTVTGGVFSGAEARMDLSLTQAGGPGNVVSASLTNASAVPEPATWVMLGLGFAALGYAAVRRNAKDKAAMAV